MSDSDNKIECDTHGTTDATFVCQHLVGGEKLGFNLGYDPEDPDDLYPNKWGQNTFIANIVLKY